MKITILYISTFYYPFLEINSKRLWKFQQIITFYFLILDNQVGVSDLDHYHID